MSSVLLVRNRSKRRVRKWLLLSVLHATLISTFFDLRYQMNKVSWRHWNKRWYSKKKITCLTWGHLDVIVDRDRKKANVVSSRDGETRGMLATVIVILMHWLLTNVCHRHIPTTTGSNHSVSDTDEQTQLLSLKKIERHSTNAWNCVLPCVAAWYSKLGYLRMLYHAGVHPPFGFLPSTKARKSKMSRHRVRAHCTNCEICASNRYLVCTLACVGILLLSSSLYLSPSLPPSPARRSEFWRWSQMRALTSILASNVLTAGG